MEGVRDIVGGIVKAFFWTSVVLLGLTAFILLVCELDRKMDKPNEIMIGETIGLQIRVETLSELEYLRIMDCLIEKETGECEKTRPITGRVL